MSGSKLLAAALLAGLFFLLSGCELFKPVSTTDRDERTTRTGEPDDEDTLDPIQSRRVYDPETGTYVYVENAPTEPMDTVVWTVVDEARRPPIVEDGSEEYVPVAGDPTPGDQLRPVTQVGTTPDGSRLLSGYQVTMALPFLTDRYLGSEDAVDPNSLWALHFYSGAKLALDEMRGQGTVDYAVKVSDTQANADRTRILLTDPTFPTTQLVIGPYLKPNVTAMAEAVRGKETVLVSPYSAATGVTAANPNYVQVNPTLETHLRSLLRHAYTNQRGGRIVLVTGTDPRQQPRLGYLQDEYKIVSGDANVAPLETIQLDLNDGGNRLARYLDGRATTFIVPVYEDESFVNNFLRLVYGASRDDFGRSVAVYGLPQWQDFSRINVDYFEGTNVHISSSVFVDKLNPAVRAFRDRFYQEYAVLPRDEAFVGYDVTRYFLRMLAEHGTRFQYALEANPEDLLHTRFRFEPVAVVPTGDAPDFERATLDRFENKYVNILRFRDFAFRRVN